MRHKSKTRHCVVLERQADRLLWLEARQENERFMVMGGGTAVLPEEESGAPLSPFQQAVQAINKKLHVSIFTGYETILVAPSHRLTARFLETPPTEEETIRDLVSFEVSEALQVPIREIAWDYHLSSHHGESLQKELLWAAARKETIKSMLADWDGQSLRPSRISPTFWSVYEFLVHANASLLAEPAVIVTQEEEHATILIANSKAIYFVRSVSRQSHGATAGVESAESILANEIHKTLQYISDRFPSGSIRKMILCGFEKSNQEPFVELAKVNGFDLLQVGTSDAKGMATLTTECELKSEHFPLLCLAYCHIQHELEGINLLDRKEAPGLWKLIVPDHTIPPRHVLYKMGALAGVILCLWIGQAIWLHHAIAVRLDTGQNLLKLAEYLQKEEIGLQQLAKTHVDYAELFLFLAETMPREVLVKTINLDARTGVDLVLVGGNRQMTQTIVEQLNSSKFFRDFVENRAATESDGFTVYLKGKLRI